MRVGHRLGPLQLGRDHGVLGLDVCCEAEIGRCVFVAGVDVCVRSERTELDEGEE